MSDAAHPVPAASGHEVVLVVDFGHEGAQLLARRIRAVHVYSEIVSHTVTAEEIARRAPAGLIFSGRSGAFRASQPPAFDAAIFDLGIPVLGVGYGAEVIAEHFGGTVSADSAANYGQATLTVTDPDAALFAGVWPNDPLVWMNRAASISSAPTGFEVTASASTSSVAAMHHPGLQIHAVQFHPEMEQTPRGLVLIKNFLHHVCGCAPTWTMSAVIEDQVETIRAQVGDATAICGLSGGVDSSVAAALVHKAIGSQLTCVFVDHGLLRAQEAEQVVESFERHQKIDLIHVEASDRFFSELAGVIDPEQKRKIIGELFIRTFEEAAERVADAEFLVQGTLYPDVLESGTGDSAKIKSHHNVGGLPDDMQFALVEPLRHLFKDEVRKLGEELGLPEEIVWRQPFPGPGLAVRIIGEVTPEKVAILQRADAIVREEIRLAGLDREIWQAFAVLPDIRSVGVKQAERTYAYPIIIRAVTSEDAMTAEWARLPHELLERMSTRIIGEVDGVNRVAYDITSKPPGTIEWE